MPEPEELDPRSEHAEAAAHVASEDEIADAAAETAAENEAASGGATESLLDIADESAAAETADASEPDGSARTEPDEPSEPAEVDPRLFEAHDLARAALAEITPESTIGDAAGYAVEEGGVVSLRFANRLPGYPGWYWTVSVAVVEGAEPTVLEVELLPGDGALLAPEWLPWAERLAEYQAAQAASAEADGEDSDEDDEDADDLDAADFDGDGSPILHAGDVDGVDIDELDDTDEDDDSEDDEDDDSEDDEDDSEDDEDDDEDDDSEDDGDPDDEESDGRESLREY